MNIGKLKFEILNSKYENWKIDIGILINEYWKIENWKMKFDKLKNWKLKIEKWKIEK